MCLWLDLKKKRKKIQTKDSDKYVRLIQILSQRLDYIRLD